MTIPKPSPRAKAPRSKPMPKCECGHVVEAHAYGDGSACWAQPSDSPLRCQCNRYVPARVSVRRSPLQRASAPIKLQHKYNRQPPKPRCKNCGHPYSKHSYGAAPSKPACLRCAACPGYEPAPIKRKTKVRKQRRTGRAALMRLADKLAGQICRARGKCEACGAGPQAVLQWAHLFSRRYHAVRWNLLNCACLCRACHFKYGIRPIEWDEWMRTALGQPAYDELRRLALKNERVDIGATVASLRAELARIGG